MTSSDLITLLGLAISAVGLVSVLIWRERQTSQRHNDEIMALREKQDVTTERLLNLIREGNDKILVYVREGDERLHGRINGMRDDSVRKEDFVALSVRLDQGMSEVRKDVSHMSKLFGQFLALQSAQNSSK